jgi:hypothetical protein
MGIHGGRFITSFVCLCRTFVSLCVPFWLRFIQVRNYAENF